MSYKTLEVELDNGRVIPMGREILPEQGRALLTLLEDQGANEDQAREVPPLGDRVQGLMGTGLGNHTDLSSNPKHLDDLGT